MMQCIIYICLVITIYNSFELTIPEMPIRHHQPMNYGVPQVCEYQKNIEKSVIHTQLSHFFLKDLYKKTGVTL